MKEPYKRDDILQKIYEIDTASVSAPQIEILKRQLATTYTMEKAYTADI